jgi:FKBP-type peptidyl-prolyl cis-trans isomerase 2
MNLATRILGVAIFVSVLAGATYAAFQTLDTDPQFGTVEIQEPDQQPNVIAGQEAPVALSLENTGSQDTEVRLSADADGFTYETNPAVITVPAGNVTRANGVLGASVDLDGDHNVTIVAEENETGDEIASVEFSVTVAQPSPPELSLEAVEPAVRPGEDAHFQATIQNTVNAAQRVNLSVADDAGSVQPQQVPLQPDGSGTSQVTVPVPADASGSHAFEFVATNEAGQSQSLEASVPVVGEGEIVAEPLQSGFTVRPGNDYTVPVSIVSATDVSGEVTATGDDVVETSFDSLQARSSVGGFVTLTVPEDASDQFERTIDLDIGDRSKTITVDVATTTSDETPGENEQAKVEMTSRLPNGTVVETTVPGIGEGPFPKSQYFQPGQQRETVTVRMAGTQQQTPTGVLHAVENMTAGESLTVTLEPEDAYGPERRTQEMEATTELQREIEFQRRPDQLQDFPKNRLPDAFDIENRTEGDVIPFEQDVGNETITLKFRVLELSEDTVSLERVAEKGETTTFFAPWPNATEVTLVNETTIVYRTTPPDSAQEEPFTWNQDPNSHQAKWGETTIVDTLNETAIVISHQPEEGIEYTVTTGRFGQQERSFRVENVTSETITLSTPNQDPRGGETVTFDLTVVDIGEAQQRRRLPPGIGGG